MLTNNIKKVRVCQEISLVYGDSRTHEQRRSEETGIAKNISSNLILFGQLLLYNIYKLT